MSGGQPRLPITGEHKRHATPLQAAAIDAYLSEGSIAKAAKRLSVSYTAINQRLHAVIRRAAAAGYSPEHDYTHVQPPGFHVKGVSSLYKRGEPEPLLQWVKSKQDWEDQRTALLEAFEELPFEGRAKPIKCPKVDQRDMLTNYPMGDPHIGMLAWHLETGTDFDLKIARSNLVETTGRLIERSPASKFAWIINLGDFFHSDNQSNRTARSGHSLDVDSRWAKCLRVGVQAMQDCIDLALRKHEVVRVTNEIGNHDDHTAVMLSLCLDAHYRNEPRVMVDTSPSPFHYYEFGSTLFGTTHGNNTKASQLLAVMLSDHPEATGKAKHRKWYTGHRHIDHVQEFGEYTVQTYRTLAPRDAWHHAAGYRSARDMRAEYFHRERGPRGFSVETVEQMKGKEK